MNWFRCVGGNGGSGPTPLPFTGFSKLNEGSMRVWADDDFIDFQYISGANIGAQVYKQIDLTSINTITITVKTASPSYNNYSTPKFSPILIIENTIDPSSNYPANTSIISANGETYKINTVGDEATFTADVSGLTGNYWVIFSSIGATSIWKDFFLS